MAKGTRSKRMKANRSKLRAQLEPYLTKQLEALSQGLQKVIEQPTPSELLIPQTKATPMNIEKKKPTNDNSNKMDIDLNVQSTISKKKKQKKKKHNKKK